MFITSKSRGYTRDGQQHASGLFLILMQPKTGDNDARYPDRRDECQECHRTEVEHSTPLTPDIQEISDKMHRAFMHVFNQRLGAPKDIETLKDASDIILDAKRQVEGCRYFRATSIRYPIRAIVRHVAMTQCGHFMMGNARVHGHRLTLSGSYGSDGLPDTVPPEVYERGLELPKDLYDAWNNGGGWNSVGSEAPLMRKWALENLKALRS